MIIERKQLWQANPKTRRAVVPFPWEPQTEDEQQRFELTARIESLEIDIADMSSEIAHFEDEASRFEALASDAKRERKTAQARLALVKQELKDLT